MAEITNEMKNSAPLEIDVSFSHAIIKEAIKTKFSNSKNKITNESIELVSEIAKVLVTEALIRAIKQAKMEFRSKVTIEHMETILPQLILDFP
ncbi:centromere protein X-like [Diorhabda carinulata]|uniref:centromere protein X-like n=1 Tax=Diorhabda carinulata TaxID=1163345 RepID=UPI0025A1D1F4|nr:centromere protein X-like [Diorhabda carinulata]